MWQPITSTNHNWHALIFLLPNTGAGLTYWIVSCLVNILCTEARQLRSFIYFACAVIRRTKTKTTRCVISGHFGCTPARSFGITETADLQTLCHHSPSELRSCVKVKVDVLGSQSFRVRSVSVDVKQQWTRTWTFSILCMVYCIELNRKVRSVPVLCRPFFGEPTLKGSIETLNSSLNLQHSSYCLLHRTEPYGSIGPSAVLAIFRGIRIERKHWNIELEPSAFF